MIQTVVRTAIENGFLYSVTAVMYLGVEQHRFIKATIDEHGKIGFIEAESTGSRDYCIECFDQRRLIMHLKYSVKVDFVADSKMEILNKLKPLNCEFITIEWVGPGGGNPYIKVMSNDATDIRAFLVDYERTTAEDVDHDYLINDKNEFIFKN